MRRFGARGTYSDDCNFAVKETFIPICGSSCIPPNERESNDIGGVRNDVSEAGDSIESVVEKVGGEWKRHGVGIDAVDVGL